MPIMDGYDATIKIRELERKRLGEGERRAYIAGLTGHATDVYKNRCFTSGMNDFSKYRLSYMFIYSD
jgi:CheY-like chemotaxis protein